MALYPKGQGDKFLSDTFGIKARDERIARQQGVIDEFADQTSEPQERQEGTPDGEVRGVDGQGSEESA